MLNYPEVYRNVQDFSGKLGYKFSPVGAHCIVVFAPLYWHKYWNYAHISENSELLDQRQNSGLLNVMHCSPSVTQAGTSHQVIDTLWYSGKFGSSEKKNTTSFSQICHSRVILDPCSELLMARDGDTVTLCRVVENGAQRQESNPQGCFLLIKK